MLLRCMPSWDWICRIIITHRLYLQLKFGEQDLDLIQSTRPFHFSFFLFIFVPNTCFPFLPLASDFVYSVMESDVARFLRDRYFKSLREIESDLPASISRQFRDIQDKLEYHNKSSPNLVSLLDDLNYALAKWRIFTNQRNGIKKLIRYPALVRWTNERLSNFRKDINEPVNIIQAAQHSSPWDRFTSFKPDPLFDIIGFEEHEKRMIDWLTTSKAIGIYGIGGTGKTTLVKKVLETGIVRDKFNNVVWACLSDLTSEEDEIDVRIVKYLLNYLGCDTDSLVGSYDDVSLLMEQLHHMLMDLGSYVVVFDDVWVCNDWFVGLCRELGESKKTEKDNNGVNVIVTSRIKEVCKKLVGENLIHLEPLDEDKDDDEKLLKAIVLQNIMEETDEQTVNEIVRHCHGLPLAAKTLPNPYPSGLSL
ncbi:putative disease resistance protein [Senna tora]|uniref:Putative disease resistance protein n=1 Tax=Senna tora TaxID=362788 RepID=A0A834XHR8_9FABA|nr:putative disease resistance protein [Senna tora]